MPSIIDHVITGFCLSAALSTDPIVAPSHHLAISRAAAPSFPYPVSGSVARNITSAQHTRSNSSLRASLGSFTTSASSPPFRIGSGQAYVGLVGRPHSLLKPLKPLRSSIIDSPSLILSPGYSRIASSTSSGLNSTSVLAAPRPPGMAFSNPCKTHIIGPVCWLAMPVKKLGPYPL
ncbi:hypothetical protein AUP68_01352 [Ilyonectria robusta]